MEVNITNGGVLRCGIGHVPVDGVVIDARINEDIINEELKATSSAAREAAHLFRVEVDAELVLCSGTGIRECN